MADAKSGTSPQMQMLQQKQSQMQRDPSDMDGNRQRPSSPGSADNAPSPSKRPRLDGGPFNPAQGGMMPNGRPVGQGMPGQQVGTGPPNQQQVQQMLSNAGINPNSLSPDQLQTFSNQSPAVQQKTMQTYSTSLSQHHNNQLPSKPMPNATGPQAQGSPMIPQGPDSAALNAYYNAGDMTGPGGMRPGPSAAGQGGAPSNHALQDYQMQLMLLEQQNKKRLMMARQEQDGMAGISRPEGGPSGPGGPGAPPGGPAGQQLQGTSPQGGRTGASPNPAEQMRRNQQHMGNAGIGSPLPENPQSRGSPSTMNFMAAGAQIDTNAAPNFFKGMNNMENNMVAAQMNGMRPPPSSHPGQPFNGQMNQQQMMAARQQQGGPNVGQMQWAQGGPNGGPMGPQGPQGQQVQGTPQPRSMPPPPSAPTANPNQRTQTASPQTSNAAPPTPQQSAKANPKKKDTKSAKSKVGRTIQAVVRGRADGLTNTICRRPRRRSPRRPTPTPARPRPPMPRPRPKSPRRQHRAMPPASAKGPMRLRPRRTGRLLQPRPRQPPCPSRSPIPCRTRRSAWTATQW